MINEEEYLDWLNDLEPVTNNDIEQMKVEERKMLMNCKPCYNFQSVEFSWNIESEKDIQEMFDMYKRIIQGLIEISPEQPDKGKSAKVQEDPLATAKQKAIMDNYSIKYTSKTTQREATKLIQASIDKYKQLRGE